MMTQYLKNPSKAITRTKYSLAEVPELTEMPKTVPMENELPAKVHATTVNQTDYGIPYGKPYLIRVFTGLLKHSSLISGTDFAGEVVSVGSNVSSFQTSNRVLFFMIMEFHLKPIPNF